MKLKTRLAWTLVALVPALAVPAAAAAVTVIGSGSSAEQPIITALIAGYKKVHHNVNILYTPDGGNAGIKDVQHHVSQFAINTRAPLPSDSGTLQTKLYLDGLCVAVNKANKLSNLPLASVRNIFLAVDTDWSQVSGSGLTGTIAPFGRDSSAGSYTFFEQAALKGQTQASSVTQLGSDGLVATAVSKSSDAIGYVGLAHAGSKSKVKALKLNGQPCSAAAIKSEKYPLTRFIWGVLALHSASTAAGQFLDWVKTSAAAGTIISKAGAVPAFNK